MKGANIKHPFFSVWGCPSGSFAGSRLPGRVRGSRANPAYRVLLGCSSHHEKILTGL